MIKRTNFLKECESVCWRRKYANWQWTVFLMIFKRAVRIDSQQSRRAVVGARKTITNRSFVCDARTPLYHTLAQPLYRINLGDPPLFSPGSVCQVDELRRCASAVRCFDDVSPVPIALRHLTSGALVRLTYVASGSVGKCCLSTRR
ncbi:hypothetical protein T05_13361 [Trichinella murrelli]|uniref:Uncharacterized protein n=1 Tax=Trichinella murrelli TaxID=144512 RepID=A0A0V0TK94_9BILA|nr:hypothetical protein T05_13361 [Trichinella murrelli]